jgi:hypothetical protein
LIFGSEELLAPIKKGYTDLRLNYYKQLKDAYYIENVTRNNQEARIANAKNRAVIRRAQIAVKRQFDEVLVFDVTNK